MRIFSQNFNKVFWMAQTHTRILIHTHAHHHARTYFNTKRAQIDITVKKQQSLTHHACFCFGQSQELPSTQQNCSPSATAVSGISSNSIKRHQHDLEAHKKGTNNREWKKIILDSLHRCGWNRTAEVTGIAATAKCVCKTKRTMGQKNFHTNNSKNPRIMTMKKRRTTQKNKQCRALTQRKITATKNWTVIMSVKLTERQCNIEIHHQPTLKRTEGPICQTKSRTAKSPQNRCLAHWDKDNCKNS